MSKQALIIIDIQNDYFPGGKWTLDGADQAADNAARLLAAARQRGDLVVHVRHEFDSADAPFFAPGSQGAAIHAKVEPLPASRWCSSTRSTAFLGTNLKHTLDQHDVEALTIAGSMSHMCIDAATRAAADWAMTSPWRTMPARPCHWRSTASRCRRRRCMIRRWRHWRLPTPRW
jgi:nicotinamidase-related amidase